MKATIYRARHGKYDLYIGGKYSGQFCSYFEALDYIKSIKAEGPIL